jgi:protein required for attachment to host cells
MINDLGIKLVAVANSIRMVLYEASGIKVTNKLTELPIVPEVHHHHNIEKSQSYYHKKSAPLSLFEPHSPAKDLEYHEAAQKVAEILEEKINNNIPHYNKLIIIAEPKMLGAIRQALSKNLQKIIYKEIAKDLVNEDIKFIEKSIFTDKDN